MRNLMFMLMFLLLSCETTVNPRLPSNGSGIVVYSFFRPGSELRIDVFNTISILQTETIQRNRDLRLRLLENGEFVEEVTANPQGFYISNIIPSEGASYSFEARTGDIQLLSSSHIPEAVKLSNVLLSKKIEYINSGEYGYPVQVSLTDPKETSNFYSLEVLVENCGGECGQENLNGKINELLIEDLKVNTSGNSDVDIGSGPQDIDGVKYIYFNDEGFNRESITLQFFIIPTLIDFNKEQNIKFVLKSITREYYEYLRTSDFQRRSEEEGGLSEPVQIATNIENGLGTFAGYSYSIYTIKP